MKTRECLILILGSLMLLGLSMLKVFMFDMEVGNYDPERKVNFSKIAGALR